MTDKKIAPEQPPQAGAATDAATDVLKVVGYMSKWKTYVIYALIALVIAEGAYIVWQRAAVAEAKLDVANKNAEVKQVKLERDFANTNEKSCRVNLGDQNGKVTDAGKRYERLQAEMAVLAKVIADGKFYKPADDVRKQPTPKTCEDTLDFLNRNFQP